MSYTTTSRELIDLLGLKGSPVAVKLAKTASDVPAGYQKVPEKSRHCQFVQDARLKGLKGYAAREEHVCKGGAGVMGIEPLPPSVADGSTYHKLGNFKTAEGALDTVTAIPKCAETHYASVYSPPGDGRVRAGRGGRRRHAQTGPAVDAGVPPRRGRPDLQ